MVLSKSSALPSSVASRLGGARGGKASAARSRRWESAADGGKSELGWAIGRPRRGGETVRLKPSVSIERVQTTELVERRVAHRPATGYGGGREGKPRTNGTLAQRNRAVRIVKEKCSAQVVSAAAF